MSDRRNKRKSKDKKHYNNVAYTKVNNIQSDSNSDESTTESICTENSSSNFVSVKNPLFNPIVPSSSKRCLNRTESQTEQFDSVPCRPRLCPILFLVVIALLFNPLAGILALITLNKSRKCTKINESIKYAEYAKWKSIVGILLSIFFIASYLTFFFFYEKSIELKLPNLIFNPSNSTESTSQQNIFTTTTTATTASTYSIPQHKLHYQITESIIPKNITTLTTTEYRTTKPATTTLISVLKILNTTRNLIKSNDSKEFDRFSILINHELFNKIKLRYNIDFSI